MTYNIADVSLFVRHEHLCPINSIKLYVNYERALHLCRSFPFNFKGPCKHHVYLNVINVRMKKDNVIKIIGNIYFNGKEYYILLHMNYKDGTHYT